MQERQITENIIHLFQKNLIQEEKSTATVEKYLRDVRAFFAFSKNEKITKEVVIDYKKYLQEKNYAVTSINSMLASLSSFFDFLGWQDCKVKNLKQQKQVFSREEKELTKGEYLRLLNSAKKNSQIQLVMQTICGTGIRVSELKYFTVEAVRQNEIVIQNKGKARTILMPGKLRKKLLDFAKKKKIYTGPIFTRNGKPLNRKYIWAKMKELCNEAKVEQKKVFPHNLRKLFARTFYTMEKDIAKLADILGHSSIETTRIYIMTTSVEHRRKIEKLGLVV